jgi:predicted N-formylglutamate amidohydrolase
MTEPHASSILNPIKTFGLTFTICLINIDNDLIRGPTSIQKWTSQITCYIKQIERHCKDV